MNQITLKTPLGTSQIIIGNGIAEQAAGLMKEKYSDSRFVIITDENLNRIYGEKFKKYLPDAEIFAVPAGEKSKCFEVVISLAEKLIKSGFTRNDVCLGFGGGMVTDLAGFIASIYMRGMRYIAVPTSLLGMVDAAIGGKTGIDFMGKNLIGTIYMADYVLIDPNMLKSFDDIGKSPGMGEVIKYAATIDASLFDDFKTDPLNLMTIIQKSAKAKADVVSQDVKEGGLRKILNFGHTFGHAIEAEMDLKISHDHAISIGMVLANKVAQNLGKQDASVGEKIKATLGQFGLPTELPVRPGHPGGPDGIQISDLVEWIKKDKKRRGYIIDFVVVPELGKAEIIPLTPEKLVELGSKARKY